MRLTEEMYEIERRMVEDEEQAENIVAVAAMSLGCFGLIVLSWAIAMVWP